MTELVRRRIIALQKEAEAICFFLHEGEGDMEAAEAKYQRVLDALESLARSCRED